MTHTQGPWRVTGESGNDFEAEVIRNETRTIAWTFHETEWNADDCADDCADGRISISDEDRANARLIASAPDLLFCLQKWMSFQINSGLEGCDEIVEQTEKAIARATGAEVEA